MDSLVTRIATVQMLVTDVDGVLTDGAVTYGHGDMEWKTFNIKDGLGIRLAGYSGLPTVLLTGRSSDLVMRRAKELGARAYQGVMDKDAGLRTIAHEYGLSLQELAYVGDDLNDLPALRLAGLPIAVADAVAEVRDVAVYVTAAPGGRGAIREVIELILRHQQRWPQAVETFLAHLQTAPRTPHQ